MFAPVEEFAKGKSVAGSYVRRGFPGRARELALKSMGIFHVT